MAYKTKAELKVLFGNNKKPTGTNFADFIDSFLLYTDSGMDTVDVDVIETTSITVDNTANDSINTTGNITLSSGLITTNTLNNVFFGKVSIPSAATGYHNVAIGVGSCGEVTTGYCNFSGGHESLRYITTGYYNVGIGFQAGAFRGSTGSDMNVDSALSVFIGTETRSHSAAATNQVVIGHGAVSEGSNTVRLGNTAITLVKTSGKIETTNNASDSIKSAGGAQLAGNLVATGDIYTSAWAAYSSSTIIGWATGYTRTIMTKKVGKLVFVSFIIYGASDSGVGGTKAWFTVPYTSANSGVNFGGSLSYTEDADAVPTQNGYVVLERNTTTVKCYKENGSYDDWTASGNKRIEGSFWYEAA